MKYNHSIVITYFGIFDIPAPEVEFAFAKEQGRKWRFDFAWPKQKVALEVDGGIWIGGGHNRGAQIKKTWEKENSANLMGWHIYKCEPKDICKTQTAKLLQQALSSVRGTTPVAETPVGGS